MKRLWQNPARLATKVSNRVIARRIAWDLKKAYEKGRASHRSVCEPEVVAPQIVTRGNDLRQQVLGAYTAKYHHRHYRILFHLPPSGVGAIWFQDLAECLKHTGIACATIRRDAENFQEQWLKFKPNVFISMDAPEVLDALDLDFILDFKRTHGCLRLFTPIPPAHFPRTNLSKQDQKRLMLAKQGKTVDAYFSMMAEEFFAHFWQDWQAAGFKYLSLPNGCNPFRHYPVAGTKKYDYFMVTSYEVERARITQRYLKSIFQRYAGLWAGPGWGFGLPKVAPDELHRFYAQSRIALNPLQEYLVRFKAETTERSFTAPACGAFQITNNTGVTHRFFNRQELVAVNNEREFVQAFDFYIKRPDERNAIALRGLERVYSEHTYLHRIDILISFLDKCHNLF